MRTAVYTIASKNYMAFVRVLMDSLATHQPNWDRFLFLVDRVDGCFDPERESFTVVNSEALPIKEETDMTFRYTIMELNTAVKPWCMEELLNRGYDRVVYLDPDIRLYQPMRELESALDEYEIVLNPHLTEHLPYDNKAPKETSIIESGTYNMGFAAARESSSTRKLLAWWEERNQYDCRDAKREGIFVDQKWMDIVPGIYPSVYLLKHRGYNTAYWNLPSRRISIGADGGYRSDDAPLVFFHFTGFDPKRPQVLSKHDTRFMDVAIYPELRRLLDEYVSDVFSHGYEECHKWPYAYGVFSDGTRVDNVFRFCYRDGLFPEGVSCVRNPYDAEHGEILPKLLAPCRGSMVIGAAHDLYLTDHRIQALFPAISGDGGKAYARWFVAEGARLIGMDPRFVAAQIDVLKAHLPAEEFPQEPKEKAPPIAGKKLTGVLSALGPVKRLFPVEWKDAVKDFLAGKAHREQTPAPKATATPSTASLQFRRMIPADAPAGINFIGHLSLERGVGEGARTTLRSLRAAGIAYTPYDLRIRSSVVDDHGEFKFPVNLFHLNVDETFVAVQRIRGFTGEHFNIAYWVWELDKCPDYGQASFQYFNEVWVPTTFCQRTFATVSPIPVVLVPHSVEIPTENLPLDSIRKRLPRDRFLVLAMYDINSFFERKNPIAAIRAFKRAFRPDDRATLVLKILDYHKDPLTVARISDELEGLDAILIEDTLSREETWALIKSCDTFISMHRSEGFGLVMAETMAMGKPAVATDYSGNRDFMTATNSYPVPYRFVEIEKDVGPYRAGCVWADPDVDYAAKCLRRILKDRDEAQEIGRRGAEEIARSYSSAVIGGIIKTRLSALGMHFE